MSVYPQLHAVVALSSLSAAVAPFCGCSALLRLIAAVAPCCAVVRLLCLVAAHCGCCAFWRLLRLVAAYCALLRLAAREARVAGVGDPGAEVQGHVGGRQQAVDVLLRQDLRRTMKTR